MSFYFLGRPIDDSYIISGDWMPKSSNPVEMTLAVKSHSANLLVIISSFSAFSIGQAS